MIYYLSIRQKEHHVIQQAQQSW